MTSRSLTVVEGLILTPLEVVYCSCTAQSPEVKGSWWRELSLPERWQRSSNFLSWRTILFSWDHWVTLIRSCWRRAVSSTQEIALRIFES